MADRLVVVWRVTEACNLACGFCRYDKSLAFARQSADRERVIEIGESLARHQRDAQIPIHVSFLGGEPLLWPHFSEIICDFRQRLTLGTGVTTNGTALGSDKIFASVLEHLDELTVSIDGLEAVHDRVRGWPGGFARLRQWLGDLALEKRRRGRGPLLRANIVLMRDNIDDFAALGRELASFGIEELTFNQLGGNDRPEFFAEHRLLPEQVERFTKNLHSLRTELASRGLRLCGGARYLERISASANARPLPISDCAPGERFLYLTEQAVASPCSFTSETLGIQVAESRIDTLASRFRLARERRALPTCADCPSTQVFEKFC